MGEQSKQIPDEFSDAEVEFKDNLVCFGYAKNREDYIGWLQKGDIVISTAIQENFGIAVVEDKYEKSIEEMKEKGLYK